VPAAYLIFMPKRKLSVLATAAIIVPLLALLAAALWFAAGAWVSLGGPPMPAGGYIAMILGIVFSLIIGCGLMALLFYSSRHGYDEPYRADGDRD
jgi:fatty acid desaturase